MATMGMSHCKWKLPTAVRLTTWVGGLQVHTDGEEAPQPDQFLLSEGTNMKDVCAENKARKFLHPGELLYL